MVCNGHELVKTDDTGRYEIRLTDDSTLFVIKPRNFMTPLSRQNLPQFFHHHVPKGSPDGGFDFAGIDPTGPLPESIDFPLVSRPEPDAFGVVLFGDPQAYTTEEMSWYARDVVAEFSRLKDVSFGIALGDLVGDNLDLFGPYNDVNAQAGFPFYNVIGNHDINFSAPDDAESDATFRKVFGPSTYFFQFGQVHFVILNNVYWNGFEGLRRDGWPRRSNYVGRIRPRDLALIRAYVDQVPREEAIVVASHIPMQAPSFFEPSNPTPEFPELLKILSNHRHTLSVSGHVHIQNSMVSKVDGPQGKNVHMHHNVSTIAGTWYAGPENSEGIPEAMQRDGTPRGYMIARFDGPRATVRYQALGKPPEYQMRIHLPDVIQVGESARVHANVFDASELSTTEFRITGPGYEPSQWSPMTVVRSNDPVYERIQTQSVEWAKSLEGRRALMAPQMTDHNFEGTTPTDLPPGLYTVEVKSVDVYGQIVSSRRPMRVVTSRSEYEAIDRMSVRSPRESQSITPATGPATGPATKPTTGPATAPTIVP